jgi:deazaflavin-dependent oxidoreductase (nitroreductase family)
MNLPGNTGPVARVGQSMDQEVKKAMDRGGTADITTIGRKTGKRHRIEIYFHQFDGQYYLTGRHGRQRDWEANIIANPEFTLHLKRGITADVPVVGEPEPDPEERTRILRRALIENWDSPPDRVELALHKWVDGSPFIRFRPV